MVERAPDRAGVFARSRRTVNVVTRPRTCARPLALCVASSPGLNHERRPVDCAAGRPGTVRTMSNAPLVRRGVLVGLRRQLRRTSKISLREPVELPGTMTDRNYPFGQGQQVIYWSAVNRGPQVKCPIEVGSEDAHPQGQTDVGRGTHRHPRAAPGDEFHRACGNRRVRWVGVCDTLT
jgi:hypothetical protein